MYLGIKNDFNLYPIDRLVYRDSQLNDKHDTLKDCHMLLQNLYADIISFEQCDLKKYAINTVFADGNIHSDIMLIGEAPGANEDEEGIPFCGISGKLLNNIIGTIGLTRDKNVYITNTVFWRPPLNRKPTKLEIAACRPFVERHIAIINPKLIIMVGSTAVESLLNMNDVSISQIRGKYYEYTNQYLSNKIIKCTAIYHPAYLLRQPSNKKAMWFDLLRIKNDCMINHEGRIL